MIARPLAISALISVCVASGSLLSASESTMIGYRGNGFGLYPDDCTPVTSWQEWTFKQTAASKTSRRKSRTTWEKDEHINKNIVWRKPILSSCNGGMIMVGGKLFMMRDRGGVDYATRVVPDFIGVELLCVDPASGELLWKRDCNHQDQLPEAQRSQAEADVKTIAAYYTHAYSAFLKYRKVAGKLYNKDIPDSFEATYQQAAEEFSKHWPEVPRTTADFLATQGETKKIWTWNYMQLSFRNFGKRHRPDMITIQKRLQGHGYNYGPWFALGSFVGAAMPTPVSDGSHIYIHTGFNDVHCFDLDGNKQWTRYFGPNKCAASLGSPILVGNKLIVQTGHGERGKADSLIIMDKTTGETLWQQDLDSWGYSNITPVHFDLPIGDSGQKLPVLWTGAGELWRLADGKRLLGSDQMACTGSARHVGVDKDHAIIVLNNGNRDGTQPKARVWNLGFLAMQFTAENKDTVTVKQLWTHPKDVMRPVAKGGIVYGFSTDGCLTGYDIVTGAVTVKIKHPVGSRWAPHHLSVIAGKHHIALDKDGTCLITDLANPTAKPQLNRLGSTKAKRHTFNEGSQPLASGNRLFIRSNTHLYCIGNPDEAMRLSSVHR